VAEWRYARAMRAPSSSRRERLARLYVAALRGTHPASDLARWRALVELGDVAVPALERELHTSPEPEVRRWAANVLHRIDSECARGALARAVQDDDDQVRFRAAFAMAQLGDGRAFDRLAPVAVRGIPWMRCEALHALGTLRDPRGLAILLGAMRDADRNVRMQAGVGLEWFGLGSVPALLELLHDSDADVRSSACIVLGRLGAPEAAGAVQVLAADPDKYVRAAALLALARTGAPAAAVELATGVVDRESTVRASACRALGLTRSADAPRLALSCIADSDAGVRGAAAGALGAMGELAAEGPLVAQLAVEEDRSALLTILDALGACGRAPAERAIDTFARARLRRVARTKKGRRDLRRAVAFALAQIARNSPANRR
jgi:HEAT repeat protein